MLRSGGLLGGKRYGTKSNNQEGLNKCGSWAEQWVLLSRERGQRTFS